MFAFHLAHTAGIIVQKDSNKIVCFPFSKFFNFGERHNTCNLDWETVFTEKLDGSLIKLYFLESEDQWIIATNNTIDSRLALQFVVSIEQPLCTVGCLIMKACLR